MPAVGSLSEAETEIMAYETTTEGTPCSPAFPSTPEGKLALVNYCAEHVTTFGDHRADAETWAAILSGEGAAWVEHRSTAPGCSCPRSTSPRSRQRNSSLR